MTCHLYSSGFSNDIQAVGGSQVTKQDCAVGYIVNTSSGPGWL